MNREILFRGKRKSDEEWIFGNLLRTDDDGICIIQNHVPHHFLKNYEVDQETICQYTGLTDENGKKIFEGDIVKYDFGEEQIGVQLAVVQYDAQYHGFLTKPVNDWMYAQLKDCEVIGNIFDNPELLDKAGEPNGKS